MKKTFYEILEVSSSASPETIEMTYQFLLKKYSELQSRGDPDAANKIKLLTVAYGVISHPAQRSLYDSRLALEVNPQQAQSEGTSILSRSTIDDVRYEQPNRHGVGLGSLINLRHPAIALLTGFLIAVALFTAYFELRSPNGIGKTASTQRVTKQAAEPPETSVPRNKDGSEPQRNEELARQQADLERMREKEEETTAIRAAMERVTQEMNDPSSAQFRNVRYSAGKKIVCGEVNEKNKFGRYIGFVPFLVNERKVEINHLGGDDLGYQWNMLIAAECKGIMGE